MASHGFRTSLLGVIIACLLGACAMQPPIKRIARYQPEQLLAGEGLGLKTGVLPATDLLAVNDEMRAFLHEHVSDNASDVAKVRQLLEALIGGGLQLRYDNFKTYTAEEAFYARAGNCMSFTTLFVALAREAGVKARFQEVDVPPIWSAQGNTWRLNLHLNAVVDLPRAQQVVDFDMNSYSSERLRRVVSDDVALAHYYNNMGVHTLSEGGLELALAYFRAAIRLVPGASHLWANVGTLYRHTGNWEAAEAAYLRALELHSDPVAYSNLARLYSAHGETKLAAYYRERVDIFRASNPYYLFYLARQAYAANDYGATKRLLRKAINRNPEDHDFYRLQGLARVQSGDVNGARRSFKRAEQLAEGDARARYQQKLQLLASMR